jgi:hypothetical protein
MRCEEIQEHLVELLYDEGGTLSPDLQNHLRTCLACRREFEELKQTQKQLQLWKDESPLRSVSIVREKSLRDRSAWRYLRYAAIAAMVVICFLALANTRVTYDRSGFSISTHLFTRNAPERDYYTKSETREIMKRAANESEEVNYLMMQKVLDTVERERWMDARLVRTRADRNGNRN